MTSVIGCPYSASAVKFKMAPRLTVRSNGTSTARLVSNTIGLMMPLGSESIYMEPFGARVSRGAVTEPAAI